MCGFVGVWGKQGFAQSLSSFSLMLNAIQHRGPDDQGVWSDSEVGLILGHRRLSILDLSEAGHQPMMSASGRYVLIFNGEVYNHNDIRARLSALRPTLSWRGHSDTETLLAAIEAWGLGATLKAAKGMFAIALWDRQSRILHLGRDRLGEKPLYYGESNGVLFFGSELQAFKPNPNLRPVIDRAAVALLMQHKYIPAPKTIYEGFYKLRPGEFVSFTAPSLDKATFSKFWDFSKVVREGMQSPFSGSDTELIDETERVIKEGVRRQLISDVPLGAFLSGGVDSSTVVALMAALSAGPVKTFTIGFSEDQFDEALYAKDVARHLGTEHHEWYVTQKDALDVIPNLSRIYSEPFGDSSQIPTVLLSKLAKQHVSVSLSGDAGDELFCGYNRYVETHKRWSSLSKIPMAARSLAGGVVANAPDFLMDGVIAPLYRLASGSSRQKNVSAFLRKAGRMLSSDSIEQLYLRMIEDCNPKDFVSLGAGMYKSLYDLNPGWRVSDVESMTTFDTMTYLPDDILCKVDRAAMSVSLEGRVPFLDQDVVEFAARVPFDKKLNHGVGKWPLKQVLYRYVPKELIDRPKMGFGVPIGHWLTEGLRDWAEDLLSERSLKESNIFDLKSVRGAWDAHLNSSSSSHGLLWNVLMFQSWFRDSKRSW